MATFTAGELQLKVVPDFSGLMSAISREAKNWGREAAEAFAGAFSAEVRSQTRDMPMGPSRPDQERQGKESAGSFLQGFRRTLAAGQRSLPDIELNADSSDVDRAIVGIKARMKDLSKQSIEPDFDSAKGLAELQLLEAELDDLIRKTDNVQLKLDLEASRADVNKFVQETERKLRELNGDIDVDTAAAEAKVSKLAQSIKNNLQSALDNISTSGVSRELDDVQDKIRALSGKTVGIDIGAEEFFAEAEQVMDRLQQIANYDPNPTVRLEAAAAYADMQRIQQEKRRLEETVEIKVDVDKSGYSKVIDFMAGLGGAAGKVGSFLGQVRDAMAGVSGAATGLGTTIATGGSSLLIGLGLAAAAAAAFASSFVILGPILGAVTAAAVSAGPALIGLGGAMGVLKLAFGKVTETLELYEQAQEEVGKTAGQAALEAFNQAKQIEAAEKRIADARQNAIEVAEQGAKSIAKADQAVARAKESATEKILDAEEKVTDARAKAAKSVEDAEERVARAVEQSARTVAQAQDRVVAAKERAVDANERAQDQLVRAIEREEDAQANIVMARERAKQSIDDLARASRGAALDEEGAVIAVEKAQQRLSEIQEELAKGSKRYDNVDLRQALLDLKVRQEDLRNATEDNVKAQNAANKAQRDGVEGSAGVIAANKAAAAATKERQKASEEVTKTDMEGRKSVAEAEKALQLAQTDARRQVADAERDLAEARANGSKSIADAEEALKKAKVEAARSVADAELAAVEAREQATKANQKANEAVTEAVKAAADLQEQLRLQAAAAAEAETAQSKLNEEMAKHGPNFRAFIDQLISAKAALETLGYAVEEATLPGFTKLAAAIQNLLVGNDGSLGVLGKAAVDIGRVLSQLGEDLAGIFSDGQVQRQLSVIGAAATSFVDSLRRATVSVLPALITLFEAASPLAEKIGQKIADIAAAFARWIDQKNQTGELKSFFESMEKTLSKLWTIGKLVFQIGWEIIKIFFPQSDEYSKGVLDSVIAALEKVKAWFANPTNQQKVRDFFQKLIDGATWMRETLIPTIFKVIDTFQSWSDKTQWFRDILSGVFNAIGAVIKFTWERVILPTWNAIKWTIDNVLIPVFKFLLDNVIKPVWAAIELAIRVAWKLIELHFKAIELFLRATLGPIFNWFKDKVIIPVWDGIKSAISSAWNFIKPIFTSFGNFIEQNVVPAFRRGTEGIRSAWEKIRDYAKAPVKFVVETVLNKGIIDGFNKIAEPFGVQKVSHISLPPGFARGGVLPGYTPGRDVHRFTSRTGGAIDLSGGEAIMRPEFTRAVGTGWVDAVNAAARSGGVSGVQSTLGGFADGGVVPGFAGGGWLDGLKDLFNKSVDAGSKIIGKSKDFLTDPIGTLGGLGKDLIDKIPMNGRFSDLMKAVPKKILDTLTGAAQAAMVPAGDDFSVGAGIGVQAMMAQLRSVFPGLGLISGNRGPEILPGGSLSYHSRDMAVDVPPIRAVGEWIKKTKAAGTLELITPWRDIDLWHGKPYRYDDGLHNQHNFAGGNAHVHWAYAQPKSLLSGLSGALGSAISGGGNFQQWLAAAMQATGVSGQAWINGMTTLVRRESNFNPRAINLTDTNAVLRGTPSKGLAQVIDPTFQWMREKSLPNDIYNPVSNLAAAINWINYRWGGIGNVQQANPNLPPMGYDNGGMLQPGLTHAINFTKNPEAILTGRQWNSMFTLANQASRQRISTVKAEVGVTVNDGQIVGLIDATVDRIQEQTAYANQYGA